MDTKHFALDEAWIIIDADRQCRERERDVHNLQEIEDHFTDVWDDR